MMASFLALQYLELELRLCFNFNRLYLLSVLEGDRRSLYYMSCDTVLMFRYNCVLADYHHSFTYKLKY